MKDKKLSLMLEELVKEAAEVSKKIYELDKIDLNHNVYNWINHNHTIFSLLKRKFPIVYHKHEPDINLFYSKEIIEDNIFHYN